MCCFRSFYVQQVQSFAFGGGVFRAKHLELKGLQAQCC